ncbi:hypothetical protein [Haloferula sargassicola]|uniref:Uncharacterized protein n=1 Tax=Haloferula sargassicola TaxID=490096 RepID=A0ABP9UK38_9BACT
MNWVSGLVGVGVIGAAGYFLEPVVQPMLFSLTEKKEAPAPTVAETEDAEPSETGAAVETPTAEPAPEKAAEPAWPDAPEWVADLKPEQLPKEVTLKADLPITVPGAKQPMLIPEGMKVTPLRVEGTDLVVSPQAGTLEGTLPVMATDLVDVLGGQPPAEPEPEPAEPEMADQGSPTGTEDPLRLDTIRPPGETADEEEPSMTETEPAGETPAEPASTGGGDVVKLMQDSIKAGDVKEFTFDQVVDWKEGGPVERDGESYQSGMASYKAETIFGVKTIQAQALIQSGKVVKWIWPNSGMEIQ